MKLKPVDVVALIIVIGIIMGVVGGPMIHTIRGTLLPDERIAAINEVMIALIAVISLYLGKRMGDDE